MTFDAVCHKTRPMLTPSATCLDTIFRRCERAYSDITLRGYRNDLEVFKRWCERRGHSWLPAAPEDIAQFVDDEAPSKSIATLKRRISAIQFAHRMANLSSPIDHSDVYLSLRRAARAKRRRPKQALGLTAELLQEILAACPDTIEGARDAALVSVGYDTLCRSSEVVAMRVEHLSEDLGSIHIPRSKADPFGDGRTAYLSNGTVKRLQAWLDEADLRLGPLFRGLHTGRPSEAALDTSSIRRRIKALAKRAGLDPTIVMGLSGHSMRVGAAQDMMLNGCDMLGIMQAGGWRTYSVVARYVEHAVSERLHSRRWERIYGVT